MTGILKSREKRGWTLKARKSRPHRRFFSSQRRNSEVKTASETTQVASLENSSTAAFTEPIFKEDSPRPLDFSSVRA